MQNSDECQFHTFGLECISLSHKNKKRECLRLRSRPPEGTYDATPDRLVGWEGCPFQTLPPWFQWRFDHCTCGVQSGRAPQYFLPVGADRADTRSRNYQKDRCTWPKLCSLIGRLNGAAFCLVQVFIDIHLMSSVCGFDFCWFYSVLALSLYVVRAAAYIIWVWVRWLDVICEDCADIRTTMIWSSSILSQQVTVGEHCATWTASWPNV